MIRNLKFAIPLALSTLALQSCIQGTKDRNTFCSENQTEVIQNPYVVTNNNSVEQTEVKTNKSYVATNNNSVEQMEVKTNKSFVANLPSIGSGYIQYVNSYGNTKKVGIVDNATVSLYKAIQKYATPEIVDIGGFYASVESMIPKNEIPEQSISNPGQTWRNAESINVSVRHLQCSQLFNKLYDIFTSPNSEKGDTITANEYTKMMEAWASTGI